MNNNSNYDYGQRGGTQLVMGLALGALVGAGIALLMAPAKGEETRRRLGETAKRMTEEGRRQLDRGRGAIDNIKGDARSAIDNIKGDARSAIDAGREAVQNRRDARGPRIDSDASRNPASAEFGAV